MFVPSDPANTVSLAPLASTRSNICLITPLALRGSEVIFKGTAGCGFTERKTDGHFSLMRAFGLDIFTDSGHYRIAARDTPGDIIFDCSVTERSLPSVGISCHAIMAALSHQGTTTLTNIALEPAPMTLLQLASQATNRSISLNGRMLRIGPITKGREQHDAQVTLPPDLTVTSTYLAALVAAGNGSLVLSGINIEQLPDSIRSVFEKLGTKIIGMGKMALKAELDRADLRQLSTLACDVWPGFPSDAAPMLGAAMAGIPGSAVIKDPIYDKRSSHVEELNAMGYNLTSEGNTVTVRGGVPHQYEHITVSAPDIRAGAALIVGALGAHAVSVRIDNYRQVHRGYADLPQQLRSIGVILQEVK